MNSNFPYRWSPASLTFNSYFYLFLHRLLHRLHQNLANKMCCLGSFFYLFLSFCNKSLLNAKVYHKIRDMPLLSRDEKMSPQRRLNIFCRSIEICVSCINLLIKWILRKKNVKIISFFCFLIPVSVWILIIRSTDNYNPLFPFSCFFLSFPAKGIIYPVCDRVQLILSYNMNLSTFIGDSSMSEFLRKTSQCIPNETF